MELTQKRALTLLAIAAGVTTAGVVFVLRGGFGVGFFLAVTAMEAALLAYLAPEARARLNELASVRRARRRLLLFALAAVILLLAAPFALFVSGPLHALNLLAILVLYAVQLILVSGSSAFDWDQPGFWLESALSYVARPFISLPALPRIARRAFGTGRVDPAPGSAASDNPTDQASRLAVAGMVLLGLLLAVPVLLVTAVLLGAADSVFAQLLNTFARFWSRFPLRERLVDLALILFLLPFVFSFLESARSRWQALTGPVVTSAASPAAHAAPVHRATIARDVAPVAHHGAATPASTDTTAPLASRPAADVSAMGAPATVAVWRDTVATARPHPFSLNPIMLISFLASINLLYIAFALVQLTYLTGAFRFSLPDGLSYAEYARSGFFELAALAPINAALIMLAVKGAPRAGLSARLLRILSLLLVLGSFVQWGSALFRMNMYVGAYGLTLLRFFVTAFMLLMAVIFGLLTVKELRPGFPLFKAAAVATVLALVMLNYVNPDAWIARHNISRTVANPAVSLDVNHFRDLSPDAALVLLDRIDALTPAQQAEAAEFLDKELTALELRQENLRWQDASLSGVRSLARLREARTLIARKLPPR